MPLRYGLAVAFTCVACHGHETVSYPEDGSLMLLQTRASMMKIAVENATEDEAVELVATASNSSSDAVSNVSATAEKMNGTVQAAGAAQAADIAAADTSNVAMTAPLT